MVALQSASTSSMTNRTPCNGGIESGGDARRGAYGRNQPHILSRQLEQAAEAGRDTRAHLERRIFRAQRIPGADGQRARNELPRIVLEGHIAVRGIDGGLRLIDAAAFCPWEYLLHQNTDANAPKAGLRAGQIEIVRKRT